MKHLTIDQALEKIHSEPEHDEQKVKLDLPTIWVKVRPFVVMLGTIFGKKVSKWTNAFVAAIDELTATDTGEE